MVKGYLPIALPPPLFAFAQTSLLFFRPLETHLTSTFCKVHPTSVDACCTRNPAIRRVVLQVMPQTRVPIGMEYREYKQYSKKQTNISRAEGRRSIL